MIDERVSAHTKPMKLYRLLNFRSMTIRLNFLKSINAYTMPQRNVLLKMKQ